MNLTVAQICAMRRSGWTISHIARRAGVPRSTLGGWLQEWGIEPEIPVVRLRRYKSAMTREELVVYYQRLYWDEGMSAADIAVVECVGEGVIADRLRRLGIRRRDRSAAIKLAFSKKDMKALRSNRTLTTEQARALAVKSAAKRRMKETA